LQRCLRCLALRNWSSLRQRADFLNLQANGQKWVTPAFIVQLSRPVDSTETSIGFTATKKLGNAVIRNRCKRRLRAMCDMALNGFETKGIQLVIIARGETLTRDFTQLTKDLQWALRKLGVGKPGIEKHDQQAV
jgi:ribonuclease P protein component